MVFPDYSLEDEAKSLGYKYIVGVDEVGRGCGAASVVAAAVHIPNIIMPKLISKVNDSKKLSHKKRKDLSMLIMDTCPFGIGEISASVIDEINILEATKLAMRDAINKLIDYDYLLVDGTVNLKSYIDCPQRQVIKGDSISISIAAASIVAKVARDEMMEELHKEYPVYNWNSNKAYLTKDHIEALRLYGPSPYHRLTFNKVR